MHTKQFYEAPEAELLVVKFEDSFLTLSNKGTTIQSASIDEWEEEL